MCALVKHSRVGYAVTSTRGAGWTEPVPSLSVICFSEQQGRERGRHLNWRKRLSLYHGTPSQPSPVVQGLNSCASLTSFSVFSLRFICDSTSHAGTHKDLQHHGLVASRPGLQRWCSRAVEGQLPKMAPTARHTQQDRSAWPPHGGAAPTRGRA